MKDNTTQKLLFAVVAIAAITLAVWSGVQADVEAPAQAGSTPAAFATPF